MIRLLPFAAVICTVQLIKPSTPHRLPVLQLHQDQGPVHTPLPHLHSHLPHLLHQRVLGCFGSLTFNSLLLYELKVCTKNTFFFPVGDRAWGFGGHNWSTLEQVILVSAQS
jgi:hypothetical protein